MKKMLPLLLIAAVLLASCSGGAGGMSDSDMATQVAAILTGMPSNTPGPTEPPTATSQPTEPKVIEITLEPTATATEEPTETVEPTATEEAAPEVSPTTEENQSGGGSPDSTAAPTSLPGTPGSPTAPTTLTPGGTPTATVIPPDDPRARLGKPTSQDPLDDADAWVWPTGASDYTEVAFKNGSMFLKGLTEDSGWRLPLIDSVPDMYIEMTAAPQKCDKADNYGIIFRVPNLRDPQRGYLFAVSCEGKFAVWKWDGEAKPKGKATMLIYWKADKAINAGADQVNRLGVMATGNQFDLYVNGVKVGSVSDTSYTKGSFGVFVNPAADTEFTVRIDEMTVWHLP